MNIAIFIRTKGRNHIMKGIKKLFFGLFISTIIILSCQVQAKAAEIVVDDLGGASQSITFEYPAPATSDVADTMSIDFGLSTKTVEAGMVTFTSDGGKWTVDESDKGSYKITADAVSYNPDEDMTFTVNLDADALRSLYKTKFSTPMSVSSSMTYSVKVNGTEVGSGKSGVISGCKPKVDIDSASKPSVSGMLEIDNSPITKDWYYVGEDYSVILKEVGASGYLTNDHWGYSFKVDPKSPLNSSSASQTLTFTVKADTVAMAAVNTFTYKYDIIKNVVMEVNGKVVNSPASIEVGENTTVKILDVDSAFGGETTWTADDLEHDWKTNASTSEFRLVKKDKEEFSVVGYVADKNFSVTNSIPDGSAPGKATGITLVFTTGDGPGPDPGDKKIVLDNPVDINMGYTYDLDDFATFSGIDAIKIKKATATITGGVAKASSTTLGESPTLDPKKLGSGTIIYEMELEDGTIIKSNPSTIRVYAEPVATYIEGSHTISVEFPAVISMEDAELVGVDGFNVYMGYGGYDLKVYSGKIAPQGNKVGTAVVPASVIENVVSSLAFQNMLASSGNSIEMDVVVVPTAGGEELKYDFCDKNATLYKITFGNNGSTSTSSSTSGSAGNFTYRVNLGGQDVERPYFYGLKGQTFNVTAVAGDNTHFSKWSNGSTANPMAYTVSAAASIYAVSGNSSTASTSSSGKSSSSSSSSSSGGGAGGGAGGSGSGGSGDYDDVPKTGESKTDIWILWGVLLVSILGAGFMIYKRFGLVKAIAQVDAEEAAAREAEEQAKIDAETKEKEERLKVLRDLRNLK